jgi:hypothetical protein
MTLFNVFLRFNIYQFIPIVFKQIFNIISVFIDKETQKKIELVKN